MKKILLPFSLLFIISLLINACGYSAMSISSPSNTPTPVTITLWDSLTGTDSEIMNQAVSAFEKAYPGITVTVQFVDPNQIEKEFITEASAGQGPDVLFGPGEWISTLAQARLVAALELYQDQIALAALSPSALAANQYDGLTYALPISMESMVLWYNKSLVNVPPSNSDDLLADAKLYGLALNLGFYETAGFFFADGSKLFNASDTCVLDQGSGTLDTLNWLKKISTTQGVITDTSYSSLDEDFISGKVGMIFEGSWQLINFEKALGSEKLAVANPLVMSSSKSAFSPFLETQNLFLSINSMGSKKAAAIKFLNYMTRATPQSLFAQIGYIPTNPQVKLNGVMESLYLQAQNTTVMVNDAEMGAVWTPAQNMIQAVVEGNQNAQTAISSAVASINQANQH